MIHDSFRNEDPRWEPFAGLPEHDLAQPDTNSVGLKSWLLSLTGQEHADHEPPVILPDGVYLQPGAEKDEWKLFVPAGNWRYDIYVGTHQQLLAIAAKLECPT